MRSFARSQPVREDSKNENILIELKMRDQLTFTVGE